MLFVVVFVCLAAGYAAVNGILQVYEKRRIRRNTSHALREEDCRQILNVSWHAGWNEIDSSYRRLLAIYEPRNFTHFDEEFRRLAEARTNAITQAYAALKAYKHVE